MAARYVTGIAPTQDVGELEKMIAAVEGVDRSKLMVLTKAERNDEHDSSFLDFIHIGAPHIDGDTIGTLSRGSIMTGSGGTGVPGIGSGTNFSIFDTSHPEQRVTTLPIPPDEADNYNDALDNGRTVIAYPCDGDAAAIESALRSAGLRKVKTFT